MGAYMTPEAAIFNFLNGFGIPTFAATSVPHEQPFPYITYDLVVPGVLGDGESMMAVNVWYRTESEAEPNAKVREISRSIGRSGVTIRCDGGMIWLKRGTPWAQAVSVSDSDDKVKRRYLNIDIEYLTIA